MASLDVAPAARPAAPRRDWTALPWPLMGAGLLLCLVALILTQAMQSEPGTFRLLLLTAGLLCAGTALAARLSSSGPAFLDRTLGRSRGLLLLLLAGLFGLIGLAAIGIFVATFFDLPRFPWRTPEAVPLCLVAVPLSLATAYRAMRLRRVMGAITAQEESAVLLLLGALCCFIACWALYVPDDPLSWDTMRLALAVFAAVALLAAPLAVASVRVRRWTVSVLIVLHFGGIASATLSATPTPWLMGQVWNRVYRPYLEFMYLNNAYHFYAPEPGPASYLWCRLIYADANGQNPQGVWYKVPDVDDQGRHQHNAALEYQRYLALIENIIPAEPTPPFFNLTPQGGQVPALFFQLRQINSPGHVIVIGEPPPQLPVPFHPLVPTAGQYSMPNASSKRLIKSCVRHVAEVNLQPPADLPGYHLEWIKAYRVRHEIPPPELYKLNAPPLAPNDPQLYQAFYLGRYDADGKLLDAPEYYANGALKSAGDPFLYWLLPVLREDPNDLRSHVHDFCRKHAGDPDWIYVPDRNEWMSEERARIRKEIGQ
jgi:hypothetical protein